MRLLVVEDEHDLADAIAEGLRQEGYAVDVAYDGETARRKALGRPSDLVRPDVNRPRGGGRAVARRAPPPPRPPPPACLPRPLARGGGREVPRARRARREPDGAGQRVLVLTAR